MYFKFLIGAVLLGLSLSVGAADYFTKVEGVHDNGVNGINGVNLFLGKNISDSLVIDVAAKFKDGENVNSTLVEGGITLKDPKTGLYLRGALGEKFNTGFRDYTYYSVEPGISYGFTKDLKGSLGYRYQTALDNDISDKTNTVRLGLDYALNPVNNIFLGFDKGYGDTQENAVKVGYSVKF